jgi:hypothetical protein
MGDGGWRRIDAAAAWHILTRVGLSALETALHGRLLKRSSELSGAAGASRRRQRGQKPLAAPRYSIAVTLRRIRI